MKLKLKKAIEFPGLRLVCFSIFFALGVANVQSESSYDFVGSEFNISGKLVGDQLGVKLSTGKKGGYAVWHDNSTDPFGFGIAAQRIDLNGNPIGSSFRINSVHRGDQENPCLGVFPNGGVIFAWEGGASGFRRVYHRVLDSSGMFISKDQFATSSKSGEQTEPSLEILKDGSAILAWTDYLADGSYKGVSARIINKNGGTSSGAFRLNQFKIGNQHKSKVAALPDGGFVAVWVSDQQSNQKSLDIVGRVFSPKGIPVSDEVILSTEGVNSNPVVATTGNSIIVSWEKLDLEQKTNRWDIGARSFDFSLNPNTDSFTANINLKGDQFSPQIKGNSNGAMLVWNSLGQDKSREAVIGRFIDSTGLALSEEIIVNTRRDHSQIQPTIANAEDDYIVAWSTPKLGMESFDIVGQRFQIDAKFALLPAIADLFVNPVSDTELMISWPKVNGFNVKHYELYFDGQINPKTFDKNYVLWPGLRPGSEYSFRVAYLTEEGQRSELSVYGVNKTWGRDYNGDELPDDWQRVYFGSSSLNWPNSTLDSDGDGATNMEEFIAGTDPTDIADRLALELVKLDKGQRLQWNCKIGAIYQVQRTNGINRNWKNIGEPVLASDNIAGISLESAGDVNFYRIKKVR